MDLLIRIVINIYWCKFFQRLMNASDHTVFRTVHILKQLLNLNEKKLEPSETFFFKRQHFSVLFLYNFSFQLHLFEPSCSLVFPCWLLGTNLRRAVQQKIQCAWSTSSKIKNSSVALYHLTGIVWKSSNVLFCELTPVNLKGLLNFLTPQFPKYFGFLFYFIFFIPSSAVGGFLF